MLWPSDIIGKSEKADICTLQLIYLGQFPLFYQLLDTILCKNQLGDNAGAFSTAPWYLPSFYQDLSIKYLISAVPGNELFIKFTCFFISDGQTFGCIPSLWNDSSATAVNLYP